MGGALPPISPEISCLSIFRRTLAIGVPRHCSDPMHKREVTTDYQMWSREVETICPDRCDSRDPNKVAATLWHCRLSLVGTLMTSDPAEQAMHPAFFQTAFFCLFIHIFARYVRAHVCVCV